MRNEYLPFVENCNGVHQTKVYKLLTEIDNGGDTVSMQVFFTTMEDFMEFELNQKDKLIGLIEAKYRGNYVFFHTLLKEF